MRIRKSSIADKDRILNIFEAAKKYMIAHGNATQWNKEYPGIDIVENDINDGNSYVLVDNDEIVGTFSFIIGYEETYQKIINGNWRKNKLYGTIHRLASNGKVKGIAKACFDFCTFQIDYVRIDTHPNNISMQSAILKYGFKECGNIFVHDGSIRIAYDWFNDKETIK